MFIEEKTRDYFYTNRPISKSVYLKPTVLGMVVSSMKEGITPITEYPIDTPNMPYYYYTVGKLRREE